MHLLYRILSQNIRPAQLLGFFIANLLGGVVLLLGAQAYSDFDRFMMADDGLLNGDQIVITKPVSSLHTIGSLLGVKQGFSESEIRALAQHPGVRHWGSFSSARCRVRGIVSLGALSMQTDMFLESVPDRFVDVKVDTSNVRFRGWTASVQDTCIPIIIPRSYLNLYNYGYATTRNLPQLSEHLTSAFPIRLYLQGAGQASIYEAHIVGFSSRINTILAPADFISEVNTTFAEPVEEQPLPTRLILATDAGQGDQSLLSYLDESGYIIEGNADTVKVQSLVRGLLSLVGGIGLAITLLAFYLLVLCVSLLTERNRDRLANLYAIGYSTESIARPYWLLVVSLDAAVWVLSAAFSAWAYSAICDYLRILSPDFVTGAAPTLCLLTLAMMLASIGLHVCIIGRKINQITNK